MKYLSILLCLGVASCFYSPRDDVEQAVAATLKDPNSAQFRQVSQCPHDDSVWQGEVNAKNSYGAYAGFKPFFYSYGQVIFAYDTPLFLSFVPRCYGEQGEKNLETYLETYGATDPDGGE